MLDNYKRKVNDIENKLIELIFILKKAYEKSYDEHKKPDDQYASIIMEMFENFNEKAIIIDNNIVTVLAMFSPEATALRRLVVYLKMTNELVKLADGIVKYSSKMQYFLFIPNFLDDFRDELLELHKSIIISLDLIKERFDNKDVEENLKSLHKQIVIQEAKNDEIYRALESKLIFRVTESGENITESIDLIKILRKLERACDHTANISKILKFAESGGKLKRFKELKDRK